MTTTYRVEIDGVTVWSGDSAEYDRSVIPVEYRGRPESGVVRLFVNDELIGEQIPLAESEHRAIVAARAAELGEGN
jgi:hypothetical protein